MPVTRVFPVVAILALCLIGCSKQEKTSTGINVSTLQIDESGYEIFYISGNTHTPIGAAHHIPGSTTEIWVLRTGYSFPLLQDHFASRRALFAGETQAEIIESMRSHLETWKGIPRSQQIVTVATVQQNSANPHPVTPGTTMEIYSSSGGFQGSFIGLADIRQQSEDSFSELWVMPAHTFPLSQSFVAMRHTSSQFNVPDPKPLMEEYAKGQIDFEATRVDATR